MILTSVALHRHAAPPQRPCHKRKVAWEPRCAEIFEGKRRAGEMQAEVVNRVVEEEFRELELALECQLCKEGFKAPVMLPCGHSFCSLCIRRSAVPDVVCVRSVQLHAAQRSARINTRSHAHTRDRVHAHTHTHTRPHASLSAGQCSCCSAARCAEKAAGKTTCARISFCNSSLTTSSSFPRASAHILKVCSL